jgi:hypothetical protein
LEHEQHRYPAARNKQLLQRRLAQSACLLGVGKEIPPILNQEGADEYLETQKPRIVIKALAGVLRVNGF